MKPIAKAGFAVSGISFLLASIPSQYAIYPAALIVMASVISALVPPPDEKHKVLTVLYALVQSLAANFGWAAAHLKAPETKKDDKNG